MSGFQTWMHGGDDAVVDFVREHERDWRWWDNPAIRRPLVSIVAVPPDDEFEAARPRRGSRSACRCAWENTTQGLPKQPIAELVRLTVDGAEVNPRSSRRGRRISRGRRRSQTTIINFIWRTRCPAAIRLPPVCASAPGRRSLDRLSLMSKPSAPAYE